MRGKESSGKLHLRSMQCNLFRLVGNKAFKSGGEIKAHVGTYFISELMISCAETTGFEVRKETLEVLEKTRTGIHTKRFPAPSFILRFW